MLDHRNRKRGVTISELLISTGVLGLVVTGSISSAILLAKIATDHENRSDFSTDIRMGMENMSYDVRNAQKISARFQKSFTLVDQEGNNIAYRFNEDTGKVVRSSQGSSIDIFSNVVTFDVLKDAGDAPSGMTFNDDEIAIETLEFEASNATGKPTNTEISQIVIKARNL